MSLSSHLRNPRSPVRIFFDTRTPHSKGIVARFNAQLRSETIIAGDADPALVGTAIDYLIRASLSPDALRRITARSGARDGRWPGEQRRAALNLVNAATAELTDTPPSSDPSRAATAALVLARFEQNFRTSRAPSHPVHIRISEAVTASHGDYLAFCEHAIPGECVSDLTVLAEAAIPDHADLLAADPLYLNPRFSLSRALGGADADVIARLRGDAGATLLDFKSTSDANPVERRDILQLLGYSLADSDDRYAINAAGISALRHRRRHTEPLADLLLELSGIERDLTDWRADFAATVAAH
jgi:hypothetical protein